MGFSIKALDNFRNASFQDADAIVNIGNDNTVSKKGSYHGAVGRMFRVSSTKAANNAARTELLRSLGNAFGLNGMGQNKDGVTTFSKGFMDKLQKLLGDEFKRNDFGISDDGTVTSGKPLTQRRVSAIVKQAILASKGSYDYETYKAKPDYVQGQIANVTAKGDQTYNKKAAVKHFDAVAKLMDFAKNELPRMIEIDTDYIPYKPIGPENPKYVLNTKLNGRFSESPLKDFGMVEEYIRKKFNVNVSIKLNIFGRYNFTRFSELKDPMKQITGYLQDTIQNYAMTSINTFIDAEKAGKATDFMKVLDKNWDYVESETEGINQFAKDELPGEEPAPVITLNESTDIPIDKPTVIPQDDSNGSQQNEPIIGSINDYSIDESSANE